MKYRFIPEHDRLSDTVTVPDHESDKSVYLLPDTFHFVTGRIYMVTTDEDKGTATVVEVFE